MYPQHTLLQMALWKDGIWVFQTEKEKIYYVPCPWPMASCLSCQFVHWNFCICPLELFPLTLWQCPEKLLTLEKWHWQVCSQTLHTEHGVFVYFIFLVDCSLLLSPCSLPLATCLVLVSHFIYLISTLFNEIWTV